MQVEEVEAGNNCLHAGTERTTFFLLACREDLVHSLAEQLKDGADFVEAFLIACQQLPGVQGLEELRRLHPTALPSWLALKKNHHVLVNPSSF